MLLRRAEVSISGVDKFGYQPQPKGPASLQSRHGQALRHQQGNTTFVNTPYIVVAGLVPAIFPILPAIFLIFLPSKPYTGRLFGGGPQRCRDKGRLSGREGALCLSLVLGAPCPYTREKPTCVSPSKLPPQRSGACKVHLSSCKSYIRLPHNNHTGIISVTR